MIAKHVQNRQIFADVVVAFAKMDGKGQLKQTQINKVFAGAIPANQVRSGCIDDYLADRDRVLKWLAMITKIGPAEAYKRLHRELNAIIAGNCYPQLVRNEDGDVVFSLATNSVDGILALGIVEILGTDTVSRLRICDVCGGYFVIHNRQQCRRKTCGQECSDTLKARKNAARQARYRKRLIGRRKK